MFDGSAKLASKDFDLKSSQSPALTGKGGQVTDLKNSEPATPKLNSATEFSLSGTKLSGNISNPSPTKQSALLASASLVKTSADAASPSLVKAPAGTGAAVLAAESAQATEQACPEADKMDVKIRDYKTSLAYHQKELAVLIGGGGVCKFPSPGNTPATCEMAQSNRRDDIKKYERLIADAEAAKNYYLKQCAEQETKCDPGQVQTPSGCCLTSQVTTTGICCPPEQAPVGAGCGCSAGKVTIVQSKDLILYNPSKFLIWSFGKSPEVSFTVTTTGKAPSKIKWSLSSKKAKITTWWPDNDQTIKVAPVSESEAKDDVTITATVDDCLPVSLPLTVRRPTFMTHPNLVANPERETAGGLVIIRTKGNFRWTVTDKWGAPLADVPVSETVTENIDASSGYFVWKDQNYKNKLTDAKGQLDDRYLIVADPTAVDYGPLTAVLDQKLSAGGWVGTSVVTIKTILNTQATETWATISYAPVKLILK